jgi:hypothetical protein
MRPQLKPSPAQLAAVSGTQPFAPPQTLGVPPPPQLSGAVQVPQSSVPPQPSPA